MEKRTKDRVAGDGGSATLATAVPHRHRDGARGPAPTSSGGASQAVIAGCPGGKQSPALHICDSESPDSAAL